MSKQTESGMEKIFQLMMQMRQEDKVREDQREKERFDREERRELDRIDVEERPPLLAQKRAQVGNHHRKYPGRRRKQQRMIDENN